MNNIPPISPQWPCVQNCKLCMWFVRQTVILILISPFCITNCLKCWLFTLLFHFQPEEKQCSQRIQSGFCYQLMTLTVANSFLVARNVWGIESETTRLQILWHSSEGPGRLPVAFQTLRTPSKGLKMTLPVSPQKTGNEFFLRFSGLKRLSEGWGSQCTYSHNNVTYVKMGF